MLGIKKKHVHDYMLIKYLLCIYLNVTYIQDGDNVWEFDRAQVINNLLI